MRILVAITSGFGHIRPSAPIAAAARDRGHEVRYVVSSPERLMAGNPRGSGAIAPADFTTGLGFTTDVVEPQEDPSLLDRLPEPESELAARMRGFFLRGAAAVPFIGSLVDDWAPEVIFRDTAGLDAAAVAEARGTPLATFDFAPAMFNMLPELTAGEVAWYRREMGLPADPPPHGTHRNLTIVGAPPSWFEGHRLPDNTNFVQPAEPEPSPDESITGLVDAGDDRPLVYVTFGTAFNTPELFQPVFDAIGGLDVGAVATIGTNIDVTDLDVPDNVRTVPFLSQGLILDRATVAVAHGGYGSLMGALRRGIPVLSLPLQPPDNRFNATRLVELGAGLAIDEGQRTMPNIRQAIERLIHEPEHRRNAATLADEIAALPPVDHAALLLEQLASPPR